MPPPLDRGPFYQGNQRSLTDQDDGIARPAAPNQFLPDFQVNEKVSAREIWQNTRRPDSTWLDVVRAILFELQPIRYSVLVRHIRKSPSLYIKPGWELLVKIVIIWLNSLQWSAGLLWKFFHHAGWKDYILLIGLASYAYFIRIVHKLFHAGPLVVVVTGLVIILTVGLDDDQSSNDRISAYSVFNRHCRAILGSIDVESLVNQYVGGGMGLWNNPGEAPQPPPRPRQRRQHQNHPDQPRAQNQGARKSGKKARRDQATLEKRRDRQRQRQEAAAMGFGIHDQEQEAMNRLIEQQEMIDQDENE